MRFKIGDIANNIKTSEEISEFSHYIEALESLVEGANLYCEPGDKEAERHVERLRDFVSTYPL